MTQDKKSRRTGIFTMLLDELQEKINKKNKKISNYLKKCDKCSLLVYLPDVSMGNYCHFTEAINDHKFHLNFEDAYLCKWNKIFINGNFVRKLKH